MSDDTFKELKEQINVEEFGAEIVDGQMIITPAESGVVLMSALTTQQNEIDMLEKKLMEMDNYLFVIVNENEEFRDLLSECLFAFEDDTELSNSIAKALWRVSGILEDGTEVKLEWKEGLDND